MLLIIISIALLQRSHEVFFREVEALMPYLGPWFMPTRDNNQQLHHKASHKVAGVEAGDPSESTTGHKLSVNNVIPTHHPVPNNKHPKNGQGS